MSIDRVPAGFVPLSSTSPFVAGSGEYYIRHDGGGDATVGTFVQRRHVDRQGALDPAFVLLLADFALTDTFLGVTLNVSAYFLALAQTDAWITACVTVRGRQGNLIFCEAAITRDDGILVARVDAVLLGYPPDA